MADQNVAKKQMKISKKYFTTNVKYLMKQLPL